MAKTETFTKADTYEIWRFAPNQPFRRQCCGCGLTHREHMTASRKGRVLRLHLSLDEEATLVARATMSLDEWLELRKICNKFIRAKRRVERKGK